MNSNNEQPPIRSESTAPTEKTPNKSKNSGLLYGLLALGVVVIAAGVVLYFVL